MSLWICEVEQSYNDDNDNGGDDYNSNGHSNVPVSYTHLDVYKRQNCYSKCKKRFI